MDNKTLIEKIKKEEEIKILKNKISILELELKNKSTMIVINICLFISLIVGIFFFYLEYYFFGVLVILLTFTSLILNYNTMYKSLLLLNKKNNDNKLNYLIDILNIKDEKNTK